MISAKILVMLLLFFMSAVSLVLMRKRILSVGGGFLWFLFWLTSGIFAVYSSPLKKIMTYFSMVSFTNFVLIFSFIFSIMLIFVLFVNQRRLAKKIERLTQEIALFRFDIDLNSNVRD